MVDINQEVAETIRRLKCGDCPERINAENGLCPPCNNIEIYVKTGKGCRFMEVL